MNTSKDDDEILMQEILEKATAGVPIRTLATQYHKNESTIRGRRNGAKNAHAAQIKAQKLSPLQEETLVDYIFKEEAMGRALSRAEIRDVAHEIIDPGGSDNTIGRHWVKRFIQRHERLRMKGSISVEASRSNEATPEKIQLFYETLSQEVVEKDVDPANLYNMDQHGITEGMTKAGKVVGTSLTRRSIVSENDCREWVSIIEAVNARGRRLKPCVVFTGNHLQGQWFPEHFPDWAYDCTQTGFTNGEICLKWLTEVFLPATKPEDPASWRILVVDGFHGHITPRFRFRALFHRVQVIYLPPHSSHLTQPLDVGVFGPLKRAFQRRAKRYASFSTTAPIQKQRFITTYKLACEEALTERNIRSGFRASGIWPIDVKKPLARVVPTDQLPASKLTPQTPKRKRLPRAKVPYTPTNRAELEEQLSWLQDGMTGVHRLVEGIKTKTGKKFEQLFCDLAQEKATISRQNDLIESQRATGRKAVKYNPKAAFPTHEEILKARPKPKDKSQEKPQRKSRRIALAQKEDHRSAQDSMMSQFQS